MDEIEQLSQINSVCEGVGGRECGVDETCTTERGALLVKSEIDSLSNYNYNYNHNYQQEPLSNEYCYEAGTPGSSLLK